MAEAAPLESHASVACFIRDSMSMELKTVAAECIKLGARTDEVARDIEWLLRFEKEPTDRAHIGAFG